MGIKDLIAGRTTAPANTYASAVGIESRPLQSALGSYRLNKAKADLRAATSKYNAKAAQRDLLLQQREDAELRKKAADDFLLLQDQLLILAQKSSNYARQQVKGHIEDLVSQALNIVYGGNHRFIMDLVTRSNRPEVDYYLHDGNTLVKLEKPDYNQGGGKINVIVIALRLGIDEIVGDKATLLLDEIGPNVDGEAAINLGYFLKEYSLKHDRQVILITHNTALAEVADVGITVTNRNGVAMVKKGGNT